MSFGVSGGGEAVGGILHGEMVNDPRGDPKLGDVKDQEAKFWFRHRPPGTHGKDGRKKRDGEHAHRGTH